MKRISSPPTMLKTHYDAIVVGSGYGGAIAASRLARMKKPDGSRLSVCVLERGREIVPGEFPDTPAEALKEIQVSAAGGHVGDPAGLYDFHVGKDMNVFMGCGLGGTSLVNANVSLEPKPWVFQDQAWPEEIRLAAGEGMTKYYRRAMDMLGANPYPDGNDGWPSLAKTRALERSAQALGQPFYRPPVNVCFNDLVNRAGISQARCTLCGDCVSGCNVGAKNTTLMNYLPDAYNNGAALFTQVQVDWLEADGGRWRLHCQLVGIGREKFNADELVLSAEHVFLGAGCLGTNEILLRSREKGLPLSDRLGRHFTGNGDVVGFGYNNDDTVNGIGFGTTPADELEPVGPCITGVIDMRDSAQAEQGLVIEEGALPGALAPLLPAAFAAAAKTIGDDTDTGLGDRAKEKMRELDSLVRGPYHGALRNTQTYLVMSHDDADGELRLEQDQLQIHWPDAGHKPVFERDNAMLAKATAANGGTYIPNPIWTEWLQHSTITVHPLGGCRMADDGDSGVVDHRGRVFRGNTSQVHRGLYVCDGSVIPRSLGVNPLLTISALAERSLEMFAIAEGLDYDFDSLSPPRAGRPRTIGIRFTETMRGWWSDQVQDDYRHGMQRGKAADSTIEFCLTIQADDLNALTNPQGGYSAGLVGTVTAPALSADALTVTNGRFMLFADDPEAVNTQRMKYQFGMRSEAGEDYWFEGFKTIRNDSGVDLWSDTTTLYVTLYRGSDQRAPVIGKGIMFIRPADLARQLTTLEVLGAESETGRLNAIVQFGGYFARDLFDIYGGVLRPNRYFSPEAPPRKKRPLRAGIPEVHHFLTEDGVPLRLLRHRGGAKGPLMLVHGAGVASSMFSTDTIQTNLLEYLYQQQYDCWLLDYRLSIDLPVSQQNWNGDQVARYDYPAAIARIRQVTGAETVQVMAHCFGATTFFMAMLSGLQHVRAAVISQVGAHIEVGPPARAKAGLYIPSLLDAIGVDSLTAYTDTESGWFDKLFDKALKLQRFDVDELCDNPVCHRISFLYALLYEHAQLNRQLHDHLHELFGVCSVGVFEHLARMIRRGHLVDAEGRDVYMQHFDRLAIPITFIHGAENRCYLPVSTERTYQALVEANGPQGYARHVIPGYGHIDCMFGKNAVRDVYPLILDALEKTAVSSRPLGRRLEQEGAGA